MIGEFKTVDLKNGIIFVYNNYLSYIIIHLMNLKFNFLNLKMSNKMIGWNLQLFKERNFLN